MLRVGLTGELGSGKSTVARLLAERGAVVLSSDEMGRDLMQPGHDAYEQIVAAFGKDIVLPDGSLDRHTLAQRAFDPQHPRIEELNAIIHPAVIAEQARVVAELARTQPHAIVVVESALIFSTKYAPGGWRERFDSIVIVTAPDELKILRFVERIRAGRELSASELATLQADARQRLLAQRVPLPPGERFTPIENDDGLDKLRAQVDALWSELLSRESLAHS